MPQQEMPRRTSAGDSTENRSRPEIRLICAKCEKEIHAYELDCMIENGVIRVYHIFCGCPLGIIDPKGDNHE